MKQLNLYLISQEQNNGYDTYDSAVVAAVDTESARRIHPGSVCHWSDEMRSWVTTSNGKTYFDASWVGNLEYISVELIGVASDSTDPGLILASFNAD